MTSGTFCWLILQEVKGLLLARWVGGATALLCACSAFSVVLSTRDLQEHTESYQQLLTSASKCSFGARAGHWVVRRNLACASFGHPLLGPC